MDINSIIFSIILAAYITGGIFIVKWMEENYFDAKYGKEVSEKKGVWRVFVWPFILPFVWPKIRKAKKEKEEEMNQWRAEQERKRNIESVVIPDTVTKIEKNAYSDCHSLKSVTIPNSVTEICKFAFSGCFDLEKVVIPASVLKIDPEAFGYNENLIFDLAADNPVYEMRGGHLLTKKDHVLVMGHPQEPIPEIVTEIGERAFNWCDDEVEEIVIPSSVKKIGEEAFRACDKMTKIVIPDSVTEIGDSAFDECDSLGEIHLPSSLRKLGDILGGESINVYSHITDPRQCKVNYDEDEPESWVPNYDDWLYVPKGCLEIYQKTEPWCYFDTIKEFE